MSRSTRGARGMLFMAVGMALSCLVSTRANAVPAFSRKYQTSCQTCHSIFPKLNPFGTAFRLNGYHLPGETEEQVKQKPVSLGADAYARMWPEMVYPSSLPGNVPFALNVKMASLYASSHDDTGKTIVHNDFQFPQEANLFAAGTLGNSFSFLSEVTYAENPDGRSSVEIEQARRGRLRSGHPGRPRKPAQSRNAADRSPSDRHPRSRRRSLLARDRLSHRRRILRRTHRRFLPRAWGPFHRARPESHLRLRIGAPAGPHQPQTRTGRRHRVLHDGSRTQLPELESGEGNRPLWGRCESDGAPCRYPSPVRSGSESIIGVNRQPRRPTA